MAASPGDGDAAGLEWLTKRFEHGARELRQLVVEEDAEMR